MSSIKIEKRWAIRIGIVLCKQIIYLKMKGDLFCYLPSFGKTYTIRLYFCKLFVMIYVQFWKSKSYHRYRFYAFFEALAFCSCKTIIPWPNSKIGHERTYLPSCRKLRTFTSKVVLLPVTQAKSQRVQNWLKFERMPFLSLFFLQFLQKMAFSVVLIVVRLSFQLFTIYYVVLS